MVPGASRRKRNRAEEPRVRTANLEALAASHREEGLQLGSQVFASIAGRPVVHFADGESFPGQPLETSHILRWYEAGMPLLSILAGRLLDREKLELDEPVSTFVKGWRNGKQACTVRHLLTHMGGFAGAELGDRDMTHEQAVESIAAYRAEYSPGASASFHPTSGWRILAEVIERLEGRPTHKLVDRHIFKPLGLRGHAFTHVTEKQLHRLGSAISPVAWTGYTVGVTGEDGEEVEVPHNREVIHNSSWHMGRWEPGISTWGSAAALGRIYEGLMAGAPTFFDRKSTIETMTAIHRSGVRDRSFRGASLPWCLGFQSAGSFGGSVGHRSFGHNGMTGRAICDPVEQVVLVYLTNGLAHRTDNERRMAEMTDALYEAVVPRSGGAWVTTSLPAVGVI